MNHFLVNITNLTFLNYQIIEVYKNYGSIGDDNGPRRLQHKPISNKKNTTNGIYNSKFIDIFHHKRNQ